jgi:hypothetical protein
MTRFASAFAAVLVIAGGTLSSAREDASRGGIPDVLEFRTMIGVSGPYVTTQATATPVRGLLGGAQPWVVSSAKGALRADGKIELEITGLVVDPTAASSAAGTNPVAQLQAVVSCLGKDASGNPATVNVSSDPFDATIGSANLGGGDARVETFVTLPPLCLAPVVFVTTTSARWLAASGR